MDLHTKLGYQWKQISESVPELPMYGGQVEGIHYKSVQLEILRYHNLGKVAYKAEVTSGNKNWTPKSCFTSVPVKHAKNVYS